MKQKLLALSRLAAAFVVAVSSLAVLISARPVAALGNICVWTGDGEDSNWSTTDNWTDCADGAPTDGDDLVFPASANRKTNVNDISDLEIYILGIEGGYSISGSAFTVTDAIEADTTSGVGTTINNNLTFGPNASGDADDFFIEHETTSFAGLNLLGNITLATENEGSILVSPGNITFGNTSGTTESIVIDGGIVQFGAASNFTVETEVRLESDALLYCNASDCLGNNSNPLYVDDSAQLVVYDDFTLNNPLTCSLDSGNCVYTNTIGSDIVIAGLITLDGGSSGIGTQGDPSMTITLNGSIGGSGNLSLGIGRITVNADNSFTGDVTIAGDVTLNSHSALGNETNEVALFDGGGTTMKLNEIVYEYDTQLNQDVSVQAIGSGMSIMSGPISVVGSNVSILRASDATLAFMGSIQLANNDLSFTGQTGDEGSFVILAPITGSGNIIYENGEVASIGENTYDGNTTVEADTTVTTGGAAGYGPVGNIVTVQAGGTIILAGDEDYKLLATVAGSGSIKTIEEGVREFTSLDGFSGTIEVEENTAYHVEGDSGQNATVVINGGTLKGIGSLTAATLNSGTLAPGNSPGIISMSGDLTLSPSPSTFAVEVNGAIVGSEYDQVVVGGTAFLNNAKLDVTLGFVPQVGDSFTILRAATIDGQFEGLPEGTNLTINGVTFVVHYIFDASGEDTVVLRVSSVSSASDAHLANTGQNHAILLAAALTLVILPASAVTVFRKRLFNV